MAATAPLRRSRRDRMIGGVLAGFAKHFQLDLSLLRIVYAIATVCTAFAGTIPYLMCWIIIPEDDGPGQDR